jgi:hypothetical protein
MAFELLLLSSQLTACFLALLFLRAGLHKVEDGYRFQGVVEDYELMSERFVPSAASAIIALEFLTSLLLIVPMTRAAGAALAAFVLVAYAAAIASNLVRGRRLVDCGCGEAPTPLSWFLVARNVALALAVLPVASGLAGAGGGLFLEVALLMLGGLMFVLWLSIEAVFAVRSRMNAALPTPPVTGAVL